VDGCKPLLGGKKPGGSGGGGGGGGKVPPTPDDPLGLGWGAQRPGVGGRRLHSSTSQLNLSRFCHQKSMDCPAHPTKGAYNEPKSGRV
jgi:hypothetical protein